MTGRVCPKHEEWCPAGECRWCAPEPTPAQASGACLCFCRGFRLEDRDAAYDEPSRFWQHRASACGPPMMLIPQPGPVLVHYVACAQNPCTCPIIAAGHAAQAKNPGVTHYPWCSLKGVMAADPAKDLAAGCTCVPFP